MRPGPIAELLLQLTVYTPTTGQRSPQACVARFENGAKQYQQAAAIAKALIEKGWEISAFDMLERGDFFLVIYNLSKSLGDLGQLRQEANAAIPSGVFSQDEIALGLDFIFVDNAGDWWDIPTVLPEQ